MHSLRPLRLFKETKRISGGKNQNLWILAENKSDSTKKNKCLSGGERLPFRVRQDSQLGYASMATVVAGKLDDE